VSFIASDASLSTDDGEVKGEDREEEKRVRVVGTFVGEKTRRKVHGVKWQWRNSLLSAKRGGSAWGK